MTDPIVNLDNCAREPIQIPGAIQPHGLLFVLREPDLTILQVSENVSSMLGIEPDQLLEQGLDALLTSEQLARVRFAFSSLDPKENNPVDLELPARGVHGSLDGFVHRHDGFAILELEPASLAETRSLDFYKIVSRLTTRLQAAETAADLLNQAAAGVREITGFDRVMIYRFADNNEGEVVAEAKAESVEPYLGLWYPASDIPEQARRLYILNPIRLIVDAAYTPAHLSPVINPDTRRPVDLSFAGLRSVSPIHCEYLRNMGVTASMSISILRGDRLWGLISCHHFSPRLVPFELRKACTFLGQVLSGEIARREVEEEAAYQSHATSTQAKFLELMAGSTHPLLGLVSSSPSLLDLIPCEGAAIVIGDQAHMLGSTPGLVDLRRIAGRLNGYGVPNTFATNSLKNNFPLNENMRALASGLIALKVSEKPPTYVFFFRPEIALTVHWGGNPEKPVFASDDGFRLSPRKSFEIWKEEVSGRALPWTTSEIRAAAELRNLIYVVAYAKGA